MQLAAEQVVNQRYRVIRLLGQGGFGAVYQVWDRNLEKNCALKENLEISDEVTRQFEREARLLANLSHPNLPRVTDHFKIPDQGQYLVMDYIEGEDLEQRLTRTGRPLEMGTVLNWINQVCDALTYLHSQDPPIIHRDIKPANIRITPAGRAVLVDFGIAKQHNPQFRTTVGARAVTPGYSPPEQYGRGSTDARSDVYALGATLYTLLTATAPPDSVDLLTGSVSPPPPVHASNPSIPPRISQAVAQAMSINREERFASIEAFRKSILSTSTPSAIESSPPVAKTLVVEAPRREIARAEESFPKTPAVAVSPSVVVPVQKPRTSPRRVSTARTLTFVSAGALFVAFIGLAAAVYALMVLNQSEMPPADMPISTHPAVTLTTAPVVIPPATSPAANDSETPVKTEEPSSSVEESPVEGAVLASLPTARIAFVSDHGEGGQDKIFIVSFEAGERWFLPGEDGVYTLEPADRKAAVTDPIPVPMGNSYDMAWWPDWCEGDRRILFEGQNTADTSYQTVFIADYNAGIITRPQPVIWNNIAKIGVPRCANRSNRTAVSVLEQPRTTDWRLYNFTLDRPDQPSRIGDGFPFSGFVTWAGDDSWIAFMHSESNLPFTLYWMAWNQPGVFMRLPVPAEVTTARFPAISPIDNLLSYACPQGDFWSLCIQQVDGSDFRVFRNQLAPLESRPRGSKPAVPAITPSWSPDGNWLAYTSFRDDRWDIYLTNIDTNIEFNLTRDLPGNQFQPSWSKP